MFWSTIGYVAFLLSSTDSILLFQNEGYETRTHRRTLDSLDSLDGPTNICFAQAPKHQNNSQGPEAAKMFEGLQELVAWCNTYAPDLDVWLTEFGYDTAQGSPDRAKQYGKYSAEQVQGMWLVRGFMLGVAAGLDVSTLTMLPDVAGVVTRLTAAVCSGPTYTCCEMSMMLVVVNSRPVG